jgi:phosphatidylglycerol---prolipoprotein diacylglyceryl transferase
MLPRLLELGPITLYSYGLLMSLGFLAGILWTSHLGKKIDLTSDTVWGIGLLMMVSAIVGAKLLLVIAEIDYYWVHPSEIFALDTLRSGGFFLGGLLTCLAAAVYYFWSRKLPGWKIADCFAPGIALGHAIGRLGCFAAGCCFGAECHLPWAVTFTDPLAHSLVGVPLHKPLHPTQLYEFLAEMAIFAGLSWLWKRKSFDGQVILMYVIVYSGIRFLLDFFRGEELGMIFGGTMSSSQLVCLLVIPAALGFYYRLHRAPQIFPSKPMRKKK